MDIYMYAEDGVVGRRRPHQHAPLLLEKGIHSSQLERFDCQL